MIRLQQSSSGQIRSPATRYIMHGRDSPCSPANAPSGRSLRPLRLLPAQVVATLLSAQEERSAQLLALYKDEDGARKEEITEMSSSTVFSSFYDQLKSVREYHRKFPSEPSTENAEQALIAEVLESSPECAARPLAHPTLSRPPEALHAQADWWSAPTSFITRTFNSPPGEHAHPTPMRSSGFTGEEAEGVYVDMHAHHEAYLNLRGVERIDYCTYLKQCCNLSALPKGAATTGQYHKYARSLKGYLISFLTRTQPLMPVHKLLEAAASDFMGRWEKGEVTRWQQGGAPPPAEVAVDLGRYGSAAELEALGLEILKGALTKHSLKAGGSLQQRAERCASARADGPPTLGGCPNHLHARDPTSHTWQPHAKPSWPPLPYIGYTCPADFSPSRLASPPSPCHPRS